MEKTILTPSQRKLLEIISKDEFITNQFFLTGGTALSQFYFKHRISEDLDFFSEKEFNSRRLLTVISSTSNNLKTTKLQQQSLTGQEVFFLHFSNEMATSFTNVIDAQDLPMFLGKTPWGKIKDYFLHQTTILKSQIVK